MLYSETCRKGHVLCFCYFISSWMLKFLCSCASFCIRRCFFHTSVIVYSAHIRFASKALSLFVPFWLCQLVVFHCTPTSSICLCSSSVSELVLALWVWTLPLCFWVYYSLQSFDFISFLYWFHGYDTILLSLPPWLLLVFNKYHWMNLLGFSRLCLGPTVFLLFYKNCNRRAITCFA